MALYTCECGYKTAYSGNATKHKKTSCGHEMKSELKKFVLEDDHTAVVSKLKSNQVNNNGTTVHDVNGNVHTGDVHITINLVVPEKSVIQSVYDAFKKPEFISDIRAAEPHEIPAIILKYTRGTAAEKQYIKYDADKNVVRHKDVVTGRDTTSDLKKYRNEYLKDSANLFDDEYHIPYAPKEIQRALKDMTTPVFETGKKKDDMISGAQVIKMSAVGDHRMYKFPSETKDFYNTVAKNVDVQIKST